MDIPMGMFNRWPWPSKAEQALRARTVTYGREDLPDEGMPRLAGEASRPMEGEEGLRRGSGALRRCGLTFGEVVWLEIATYSVGRESFGSRIVVHQPGR